MAIITLRTLCIHWNICTISLSLHNHANQQNRLRSNTWRIKSLYSLLFFPSISAWSLRARKPALYTAAFGSWGISRNGLLLLPIRLTLFDWVPLAFSSALSDGDFFIASTSSLLREKKTFIFLITANKSKLSGITIISLHHQSACPLPHQLTHAFAPPTTPNSHK